MTDKIQKLIESDYGTAGNNFHVERRGQSLNVTLTYPAISKNGCVHVVVDQESVRASDGVRLTYDYDRDGWSIQQASRFAWSSDDKVCDEDWQEVAFIQSWARAETEEQENERLGFT
ncbi:hypothetical protein [Aureimonas ureilytica]|uniref:hypothetical protein n=1 Tax=Aureimonas ureilytica TaxID=401562 RepID=UPI000376FAB1|nr:hypothetical protein [Aureimonas ureilytica]